MSHSNSSKVGEIFTAAGAAFCKLSEIIMTLQPIGEQSSSNVAGKSLGKRKSTDDSGIQVKKQLTASATIKNVAQDKIKTLNAVISQPTNKTADLTLNMLNIMEPEVDVEGLSNKLDYDSSDAS